MILQQLRTEIDKIDRKLVILLNQRAQLALQIGEQKKKLRLVTEDKQREQKVLRMIINQNDGPLSDAQLVNIFQAIIAICKNIQQQNRGDKSW